MKNPSMKLSEAFVSIVVIRIHVSNWEVLEVSERNEENIIPSDPITLRRVGSSSSLSIQEIRRSGDIQDSFNPSSNPEFTRCRRSVRRSQERSDDAEI